MSSLVYELDVALTPINNKDASFEISEVPNVKLCRGVITTPNTSDLLVLSQKNYRTLLECGNSAEIYCPLLANTKNEAHCDISLEGLMGFFLPRRIV